MFICVGVMPPDEYAENVSNSAYTNMVAIQSLESAAWVALYLGFVNHTIYDYYARHMFMPFNKELQFHPEYEGYITGVFSGRSWATWFDLNSANEIGF